jgi:hypothetical protein
MNEIECNIYMIILIYTSTYQSIIYTFISAIYQVKETGRYICIVRHCAEKS